MPKKKLVVSRSIPPLTSLCVRSMMFNHQKFEKDDRLIFGLPVEGKSLRLRSILADPRAVRQQIALVMRAELTKLIEDIDEEQEEQDAIDRGMHRRVASPFSLRC